MPLAMGREEEVVEGERVVVMMGTGEEGGEERMAGADPISTRLRTGLKSLFRANFPFSILAIVNDRFFGMVCGLEDGSRLDMRPLVLESDPLILLLMWADHLSITGELLLDDISIPF